jgi:hypothetical protein
MNNKRKNVKKLVFSRKFYFCPPKRLKIDDGCSIDEQGCQIFLGATYQNGESFTK